MSSASTVLKGESKVKNPQVDNVQDACLNDDFVCLLPRKIWFLGGVRSFGVMCCGGGGNLHFTHVHVSDLRLEPVRLGVRAEIEPKYSLIRASARASIEP